MRVKLKKRRTNLQMTQEQVAIQAGIKREHYTKIELGDSNPSFKVFLKLKEILGATDEDFDNFDEKNDLKKTG